MAVEKVKVSVNLTPQDVETLKRIATKRGNTVTETLRRAIALEKLYDAVDDAGGSLVIEEKDNTYRRVLIR